MEARAAQLDDAEVAAAATAVRDETPVYNEFCRGSVDAPEPLLYEQGTAMIRGSCHDGADTPAAHAIALLLAAPADRVARALVARAATLHLRGLGSAERDLLRARGPEASAALLDAVAAAHPDAADPMIAVSLLQAAGFASPGSGSPAAVALVERATHAPDPRVQARARAALLRLTDRPGPEPAAWSAEPRVSAVSGLAGQIPLGDEAQALLALADIGPSAAPLLDAILAELPVHPDAALAAIKAIGPRAHRASAALIAYQKSLHGLDTFGDLDRHGVDILEALLAVEAPAADIEATARRFLRGSMELMVSALTALIAVRARVSEAELAGWDEWQAAECSTGRLVRMSIETVRECDQLWEAIAALRKAQGGGERSRP
jgi:hypothetical protein